MVVYNIYNNNLTYVSYQSSTEFENSLDRHVGYPDHWLDF